jgi:uncharacterized integral membrane protein (TIGR00697 family)
METNNKKLVVVLASLMALVVVVSNILVQYLLGDWLTWAAFTYPVAFLITDISNKLLGAKVARKIIIYGFLTGVFCSLIASQLSSTEGVPYTTIRIALGSGLAFLLAQLTDIFVFNKIKQNTWYLPPFVSSFVGSILDTAIFFTIAFSSMFIWLSPATDVSWATESIPLLGFGFIAPLWVSLAVADLLVKLSITLVALIPFRIVTKISLINSEQKQPT